MWLENRTHLERLRPSCSRVCWVTLEEKAGSVCPVVRFKLIWNDVHLPQHLFIWTIVDLKWKPLVQPGDWWCSDSIGILLTFSGHPSLAHDQERQWCQRQGQHDYDFLKRSDPIPETLIISFGGCSWSLPSPWWVLHHLPLCQAWSWGHSLYATHML